MLYRFQFACAILSAVVFQASTTAEARPIRITVLKCAEYQQEEMREIEEKLRRGEISPRSEIHAMMVLDVSERTLKCLELSKQEGAVWFAVGSFGGLHVIREDDRGSSGVGSELIDGDSLLGGVVNVTPMIQWDFTTYFGLVLGIPFDVVLGGDQPAYRLGGLLAISWGDPTNFFGRFGMVYQGYLTDYKNTDAGYHWVRDPDGYNTRKDGFLHGGSSIGGLASLGYEFWVSKESTLAVIVGLTISNDESYWLSLEWRPRLMAW